jgi:hypothetical protein
LSSTELDEEPYSADQPSTTELTDVPQLGPEADPDEESERFRSTVLGLLGFLAIAAVVCIGLAITVGVEALVRVVGQLLAG